MTICSICNNSDDKLIKRSFLPHFNYCETCGGHFLSENIVSEYREEYFQEKYPKSFVARLASPLLNFFLKFRVGRIKIALGNTRNPKILDYGCGSGKLVKAIIEAGMKTTGFELSPDAAALAQKQGLPVYLEIKSVPGGYNLIMFWHSLEHTPNPLEVIRNAEKHLAPNGKFLIAVPNAASWEARIFKENWFHYSYPLHRIHFTPKSVKIMLQKAGFEPISIDFWNPEYTISGLVQSFLNWFLPKDTLYSVISHRRQTMPLYNAILISLASILIILIFSPFLALFFIFQLIFCKTGAMVIVADKVTKI